MNRIPDVRFLVRAGLLLCLLLVPAFSAPAPPPPPDGSHPPGYAPRVAGEVLVKFKPAARAVDKANARSLVDGRRLKRFRSGAEHWKIGKGLDADKAIALLSRHPQIEYAEPNYIAEIDLTPNDPSFPSLWGLNNTGASGAVPGADIDAVRAWDVTTGTRSVVVGVIDTGVDYTHPELAANIWTNPGEIPGNGVDDDGNGYVDDVHGWDFVNHDNDPIDDHNHGTHVSGTIGALGDNGIGVVGVNWEVSIVPLKFLSASGFGSYADAVSAIDYAAAMRIPITSNSWGGSGFSQALLDAIEGAGAAGSLTVAAAGNAASNTDINPHYPSAFPSPYIVSVAATNDHDLLSSFSNYGLVSVDLGAPGSSILSTIRGNSYAIFNGTSMATPHVSGTAALILSVHPGTGPLALKQGLLISADPLPALLGKTVSGGRLNAFKAVAELDSTPPGAVADLAAGNPTSGSLTLTWTAPGDDGPSGTALSYDLRWSSAPIDASNFDAATPVPGVPSPSPAGTPESFEVMGLSASTTYHFAIRALDEWDNAGAASNDASGTTLPPPTFDSSPRSFAFSLLTGERGSQTLTIRNVGDGTLDWSIPSATLQPATAAAPEPALSLAKGEADPRTGPAVSGTGGPDRFGYRFVDSEQPSGPSFLWNDISVSGTPIASLDGDDQVSEPIDLGFTFPFYGEEYDSVRVSTDGWLSFVSSVASPAQQPLPCAGAPPALVAPFWTDLDFEGAPRASFQKTGGRFTVQFTNVARAGSGERFTFQATLQENGRIVFQYLSVPDGTGIGSVGLQDPSASDGVQVAFNTSYLHDGLAIELLAVRRWLSTAPSSGRVLAGGSQLVSVDADATGLSAGTYTGTFDVLTNDPGNPSVPHDVTLIVGDAPAILFAPASIDFGQVHAGFSSILPLTILSSGTEELTLSSITSADPSITVSPDNLTLAPGELYDVSVTYAPTAAGTLASPLVLVTNVPSSPTIQIPLSGTAVASPEIQVSPVSFSETLNSNDSVARTLTVANDGAADLHVALTAEQDPVSSSSASASWSPLPKGDESANGSGVALSSGGPVATARAAYSIAVSDSPGGPAFDWVEIAASGDLVPLKYDDEISVPIPLGFRFPFFGASFDSVRISTNGWLSFTSSKSAYSNPDSLPNSGPRVPENLIAPFFDDLDFAGVARARTKAEPGRFIVEFSGVDRFTKGSELTFEAILHDDGRIDFQYLTMSGVLDSATIGLQDAGRGEGVLVGANRIDVHDGLAISLVPAPQPVNAGFEDGSFSGWTALTTGSGELTPWTVRGAGGGYFGTSLPFEGGFDALNGFDGAAGLHYTLYQDVTLPAILTDAELSFYDRIQFNSQGRFSSLPRVYEATIRDTAGTVLEVIAREEILLSGKSYTDLGWQRRSADLTPYAGQTIRIQIDESIPESNTGPALIEFDGFRIGTLSIPNWLAVSPPSDTIPPGGSRDFTVTFDATGSGTIQYHGAIRLDTDDPAAPTLRVPAVLHVIGVPDIALEGQEISVESVRGYSSSGDHTEHHLAVSPPAGTRGEITLIANGDYGFSGETATLSAEGITFGSVGVVGTDCVKAEGTFPISEADLAQLAADGVVDVLVSNSAFVDVFCAVNEHRVRLTYRLPPTQLDFGSIFVGAGTTLEFTVLNRGPDPLVVSSITSDEPVFSVTPTSFTVPPGGSLDVTVTFVAAATTAYSGTLTISSNDPDSPVLGISLIGTGLAPPVAGVQPASLSSSLLSGQTETQVLGLSNSGGSDLTYGLSIRSAVTNSAACSVEKVYVGGWYTGILHEVDLATGSLTTVATGLGAPNKGIAQNRAATKIYVTESGRGTIAEVDPATGNVQRIGSGLSFPNGLALTQSEAVAYVTETGASRLIAVDLATGSFSIVAVGLSTPNAVVLDSRGTTAYVAEYGSGEVSAVDIATGAVSPVASGLAGPANLALNAIEDTLYVVEDFSERVSAIDVSTGAVTSVAFLGDTDGGMALDPDQRTLYVTLFSFGQLVKVDIPTGVVTLLASGIAGPVGVLPALPPGCGGGFLSVSPAAGSVAAGSAQGLDVRFDATYLFGGEYAAEIVIATNDPLSPQLVVPASLSVTGVPRLAVAAEPIVVESVKDFTFDGETTLHSLPIGVPAPDHVSLELIAEGDFGDFGERANFSAEGIPLGFAGETGTNCAPARIKVTVSGSQLDQLAADGEITAQVANTSTVAPSCPVNRHTVRLSYDRPAGGLDFGEIFTGTTSVIAVEISNAGTDTLAVTSVTTDMPAYSVQPSVPIMLAPGGSVSIPITFSPPAVGDFDANLTIVSNDPAEPVFVLTLSGSAVDPPVIGVSPASVHAAALSGTEVAEILTIANTGSSDLHVRLREEPLGTSATSYPFEGLDAGTPGPGNGEGGVTAPAHLGIATEPGSDPATAPAGTQPDLDGSFEALPGDFELLSSSPAALTCVVADTANGILYAQQNQGRAFFKYDVGTDAWSLLTPAPFSSGNNGGAVLFNGRIYTTYASAGFALSVYDIASGTWSLVSPHPLGQGTANIATDGSRYLYLAGATKLVRFEPSTRQTATLAAPPFAITSWGGLEYHDGKLYAHQGNNSSNFAVYTIATNTWQVLTPTPAGAVLGSAFDEAGLEFYAYGPSGGRNLYAYDTVAGRWSVRTIPFFSVVDGGMAWIPAPVAGIYFVQGESGTGFARLITGRSFLSIDPTSATIPAGSALDVQVSFDARNLLGGEYATQIGVTSNDPLSPRVVVPASVTVTGIPDIAVTGATVSATSSVIYDVFGAITMHSFVLTTPPAAGASFTVLAEGNFPFSAQTATLSLEGINLGTVGNSGLQCSTVTGTYSVLKGVLASAMADGHVDLLVTNTLNVSPSCPVNRHTVTITYGALADRIDFGDVFTGATKTSSLVVENEGTDVLTVSVSTGAAEFSVTPASFQVAPNTSRQIDVHFAPSAVAAYGTSLSIGSDDPDEPLISIPLTGTGIAPPVVEVSPASLHASVSQGQSQTQNLTISNTGASALDFSLDAGGASFLAITPASGHLLPGTSQNVGVKFSTGTLPPGTLTATITVASNDPVNPAVSVPVTFEVRGLPRIKIPGTPGTVSLSSSADFTGVAAATQHHLAPAPSPIADGSLEVTLEGDFSGLFKTAAVTVEGSFLGTVNPTGFGCTSYTATLTISQFLLDLLRSDGALDVRVANATTVDASCPVNRHTVKLTYPTGAAQSTDFGAVIVGAEKTSSITIQSVGTAPLDVTLTGTLPEFWAEPSSLSIPPGGSAQVALVFAPSATSSYSGNVRIASNDSTNPLISWRVVGVGLPPPVAGIDNDDLEIAVPPGGAAARTVRLSNTGEGELIWSTQSAELSSAGQAALLGSGAGRVGGPDEFGYVFRDGDAPGGPAFAWEDVDSAGVRLPMAGDDESSGPIPIGFPFPFYGATFTQVSVTTNGWLSFTNGGTAYRPSTALPDAGPAAVENLVAPFWADLDLRGSEKVSYLADGQRFVVQYAGVDRIQGDSDLTFQAVLFPDGRIRFQYLSMSGVLDAATIGIQNGDGSAGLLVSAGEAYARDGLAVEIVPPPASWLTAMPPSGTVPPGGYTDIDLTADATGLPDGDHRAVMSILNNDPVHNPLDVSVLLHSGFTALDLVDVEPNTLNLGSQGKTVRARLQLPPAYDPHDILLPTVSLNGVIFPRTSPIDYADENGDGIEEMILKFDRAELEAILPEGTSIPVTISGEVRNKTWFSGTDHIRAIRPRITSPQGGEYILAGEVLTISWEPPAWQSAMTYDLILSRDGGSTWESLASGLTGLSYGWTAGGPPSSSVLVRVFASDNQGVLGYDTSDAFITIADALHPPNEVAGLTGREVNGELELAWPAPPADLSHGPASSYKVMAAPSPAGPFTEIGSSAAPSFRRGLAADAGALVVYKVVAVNAAGDSP